MRRSSATRCGSCWSEMLKRLHIENIAVIETADIEFMPGLNVLSGETGAGKSIIIDSINAILGARVSREMIRTGQERAVVSAEFSALAENSAAQSVLRELGLEFGTELRLRRDIYADGRNACRINDAAVPLASLRALGAGLIDIYGQHDGQNLLNEQMHMEYLDDFAGIAAELSVYEAKYEELLHLNRMIKSLSMSAKEQEMRKAVLDAQIQELSAADVRAGEKELLTERRTALINGKRVLEIMNAAVTLLSGDDGMSGAEAQLGEAEELLRKGEKYGEEYVRLSASAKEISVLARELSSRLSDMISAADFSPKALEDTEERLELIQRLESKYSSVADELGEVLQLLKKEQNAFPSDGEDIGRLKEEYVKKRGELLKLASGLHARREAAAEKLAERLSGELRELDMPDVRFCAEITDGLASEQVKFTKKGTDTVRFLMSANRGEALKPLSKVASGGELSRIMLAMKNVLAFGEGVTGIFDEIDAGVSGRAASRVGEKLYAISRSKQVLCVTHLPQIACLADHQYHISKHTDGSKTYTTVELLHDEGRISELARMTAGLHVTDVTIESAGELLKEAEKYKRSLKS